MTRSRKERKARKQQLEQRAEAASPRRVKRKARRNKPLSAPPLRSPETFRELLREIREILFRRRTVYSLLPELRHLSRRHCREA